MGESGECDEESLQGGYYADGAYTAAPNLPDTTQAADRQPSTAQQLFHNSLLQRLDQLRTQLKTPQPFKPEIPPASPFLQPFTAPQARHQLLTTPPHPTELASLPVATALRLLGIVTAQRLLVGQIDGNLSAWIWGLLAVCGPLHQLWSEEVSVLRDFGRAAGVALRRGGGGRGWPGRGTGADEDGYVAAQDGSELLDQGLTVEDEIDHLASNAEMEPDDDDDDGPPEPIFVDQAAPVPEEIQAARHRLLERLAQDEEEEDAEEEGPVTNGAREAHVPHRRRPQDTSPAHLRRSPPSRLRRRNTSSSVESAPDTPASPAADEVAPSASPRRRMPEPEPGPRPSKESEDAVGADDEEEREGAEEGRRRQASRATLETIVCVVGHVYGQRDLLEMIPEWLVAGGGAAGAGSG